MDSKEGAIDSFEVVKQFLRQLGGRTAQASEVREISWALGDIYRRLMNVRRVAPTVDLSERMWSLMATIGISPRPVRKMYFPRAAGLL